MPPRRPRPPRLRRAPLRRAYRAHRRRRTPEDARKEILDAAERLFATDHPDSLGLKPVARAAGVSHALITHYFGSYYGLIDAVLERRQLAMREAMLIRLRRSGATTDPRELIALLFEVLGDPVQVRLWLWTLATERPAADDFFPLRHQGLRTIAGEIAHAIATAAAIPVEALVSEVELAVLVAVSAAFGYNLGKRGLVGSLGRAPSRELDAAFQLALAEMASDRIRRIAETIATAASGAAPRDPPRG